MFVTIRAGAVLAGAALLLGSPLTAQAADRRPADTTGSARAAGFHRVTDVPFDTDAAVSPTDGTVVVAGRTHGPADSVSDVRLRRYTLDGAGTDIAVPATASKVQLATAGGATWLLATGDAATLWRIDGDRAVQVPVPTPATFTSFTPTTIAADSATSLWVGGQGKTPDGYPFPGDVGATHWNGRTWTPTQTDSGQWSQRWSFARDGFFYLPTVQPVHFGPESVLRTTGNAWENTPHAYLRSVTMASGTDYTTWGRTFDRMGRPTPGDCLRVVDNKAVEGGCVAPRMPVADAARLSDGRIVLGGSRSTDPKIAPGEFMLAAKDGATPVSLPGSVGITTVDLAAEPTGTHVWSLNRTESKDQLQLADLGPARPRAGFAPVAGLPGTAQDVVSPAVGVAYASGVVNGTPYVRRIDAAGRVEDVSLPATGDRTDLVAVGGHVGLLVTSEKGDTKASVWEIVGRTAHRAWLPDSLDRTTPFRPKALAADATNSVWVTGSEQKPNGDATPTAAHWDGTGWSRAGTPQRPYGRVVETAYAANRQVFLLQSRFWGRGIDVEVQHGSATTPWTRAPKAGYEQWYPSLGRTTSWTLESVRDYTMWGYASTPGGNGSRGPDRGDCVHVVDDAVSTAEPCTPPAWAVGGAARLADGRVVLGGATSAEKGGTAPGFAVVTKQGATPTPLAGTVTGRTVRMGAEPTGGGAWALTSDGARSTLQRADLGGAVKPSVARAATTPAGFLPARR